MPPTRSKVSGILTAVACAACCVSPLLTTAGVLTTAGARSWIRRSSRSPPAWSRPRWAWFNLSPAAGWDHARDLRDWHDLEHMFVYGGLSCGWNVDN